MTDKPTIDSDEMKARWGEITNIVEHVNQTNGVVTLINCKDPNDNITIDAHNTAIENVHVPWADNEGQFLDYYGGQRLEITVHALNKFYCVWQSGLKVRFATSRTWSANAPAVPGAPQAGGIRKLYIRTDGSLYLEALQPV